MWLKCFFIIILKISDAIIKTFEKKHNKRKPYSDYSLCSFKQQSLVAMHSKKKEKKKNVFLSGDKDINLQEFISISSGSYNQVYPVHLLDISFSSEVFLMCSEILCWYNW